MAVALSASGSGCDTTELLIFFSLGKRQLEKYMGPEMIDGTLLLLYAEKSKNTFSSKNDSTSLRTTRKFV